MIIYYLLYTSQNSKLAETERYQYIEICYRKQLLLFENKNEFVTYVSQQIKNFHRLVKKTRFKIDGSSRQNIKRYSSNY